MSLFTLSQLDNGLRIATDADANGYTAAIAIGVDVGARHEQPAENGLSHLLEHMAFKGSSKHNAREIAEAFDLMGGNVNAYTSHEHTIYYAKVLKEYAADATALLCEIATDFAFDQTELERERQVILQEIAMTQDTPDDLITDFFQEAAFADQPLGRSILGDPKRVSRFTREDLLAYTAKHYVPKRMVVAAAGNVQHAQIAEIAAAHFAHLPAGEIIGYPEARYTGGEKLQEKDLEQVQLMVGYPAPPIHHADYFPLQVFTSLLGGGMSSRLFQEVREKRGLAYAVSSSAAGYHDVGVMNLYAGTTVEHLPELLVALREVSQQALGAIGEEELIRAKNQLKAGVVMSRENCGSVVEWMARHILVYGRVKTAEEITGMLDAVTIPQMQAAARQCFAGTPTIAALGPQGSVLHAGLAGKLAA